MHALAGSLQTRPRRVYQFQAGTAHEIEMVNHAKDPKARRTGSLGVSLMEMGDGERGWSFVGVEMAVEVAGGAERLLPSTH